MAEEFGERVRITADALRDGSLIAMARARVGGDPSLLSDAAIEASLDAASGAAPARRGCLAVRLRLADVEPGDALRREPGGRVRGWHRSAPPVGAHGARDARGAGTDAGARSGWQLGGAAVPVSSGDGADELLLPWRREMFTGAYLARWVRVDCAGKSLMAASFVANHAHPRYAGRLDDTVIARSLAVATGSLGSCVEYLAHTLAVLRAHGLTDRSLERLERMVAQTGAAC